MLSEQTRVVFTKKIEIVDVFGGKLLYNFETGENHVLTDSTAETMEYIKDGSSVAEIINAIMEDFDVSYNICLQDTSEFLLQIEEKGFLKLESESSPQTSSC